MQTPEQAEQNAIVMLAVLRLPHSKRDVVLLRMQGYTHREIAQVVGCSEGASRVRNHRAKHDLRDRLRKKHVTKSRLKTTNI